MGYQWAAILGLVLVAGCGRLAFDSIGGAVDAAADGGDAPRDASEVGPGPFVQGTYGKASNAEAEDRFGRSVALSADGSTLVVSADAETSAATGVGGDQADNTVRNAGAVYVFARAGAYTQEAYLKASNTGPDQFGLVIALSADGSTLAVGAVLEDSAASGIDGDQADNSADNSGAVYVFTRTGTTWAQQAYIKASNPGFSDFFGRSLALSADGSTLVVGASGEASAATGIGGDQTDDSAANAGAVYVFTRAGTTWTQQAYLKASNTDATDNFGASVALAADGATLVVAAPFEDSAATGIGGDQADNSAMDAGAVYLFTRTGTTWSQRAYVKASNARAGGEFGGDVAMSADGSTFAVGASGESSAAVGIDGDQANNAAPRAGAVYVFVRAGASWVQQAYIKASNAGTGDSFGARVALSADGSLLAAAAPLEDSAATGIDGDGADDSALSSGAAYVFARSGTTWTQHAYVKASNTDAGDQLGGALALSADASTLAIGASGEDGASTGIGGDEADNSAMNAGAVYVFDQQAARGTSSPDRGMRSHAGAHPRGRQDHGHHRHRRDPARPHERGPDLGRAGAPGAGEREARRRDARAPHAHGRGRVEQGLAREDR